VKKEMTYPKIRGKILLDEPLAMHSTFRVGGPCRVWIEPSGEDDLKRALTHASMKKEDMFVIGRGSNVLFREKGFDGMLIHLGAKHFTGVEFSDGAVRVGAGASLSNLINLTCKMGLSGMQGLVGIPGSVGGALFMNSGYKGNISDCLDKVKVLAKSGAKSRVIKRKDIKFRYRKSGILRDFVILEATFRLKRRDVRELIKEKNQLFIKKKIEQPLEALSAGCIFRNPSKGFSAAKYIEMLRLKGKEIGGAKISEKHANFIVNHNNAKGSDILNLIEFAKKCVKSHFGVDLVSEVIIL